MSDINIAVDPGNIKSGWVTFSLANVLGGIVIHAFGIDDNWRLRQPCANGKYATLVCEMLKKRGMPTSDEEFETCVEIGRLIEAGIAEQWTFAFRMDIKMHLCGRAYAKDPNIRRALIDRFGGDDVAIGGVKCKTCHGKGWRGRDHVTCDACNGDKWLHPPGPLKGIAYDGWAALAVACYYADTGIIRQRLVETK